MTASDPRVVDALALWEAEHAFARSDDDAALIAADRVSEESPGWAAARRIAMEVHRRRGDLAGASRAGSQLARILRAVVALHAWRPREQIGAAYSLDLPERGGRWFAPLVPFVTAWSYTRLCLTERAAEQIARGWGGLAALESALDHGLGLDDAALWRAWTDDAAWPDAGLRYLTATNPVVARAVDRARSAIEPRDEAVYLADAMASVRGVLEAAAATVADARTDATLADWAEARRECESGVRLCAEVVPRAIYPHRDGDFRHNGEEWWFAAGWRAEGRGESTCVGL